VTPAALRVLAVACLCGLAGLTGCTHSTRTPETAGTTPGPASSAPPTFVPTPPPDGLDPSLKAVAESALPEAPEPQRVWRGVEQASGAVNADQSATGQLALQATCVGTGETVQLTLTAKRAHAQTTVRCVPGGNRANLRLSTAIAGVVAEAKGPANSHGVLVWQLTRS
jgi:hypothetical protein